MVAFGKGKYIMKKSISIMLTLALVFGAFGTLFATSVSAATTYKVLDNIQYFKVNGRIIEKNQLDQAGSSLEWNANCSGDVKVKCMADGSETPVKLDELTAYLADK